MTKESHLNKIIKKETSLIDKLSDCIDKKIEIMGDYTKKITRILNKDYFPLFEALEEKYDNSKGIMKKNYKKRIHNLAVKINKIYDIRKSYELLIRASKTQKKIIKGSFLYESIKGDIGQKIENILDNYNKKNS
ncbi:hypothetical protein JW949_00090 [Candidatus Woesearchaeota archaeon]|nr:hypothetical protein [Candidatus Woesearchaeota archaeon]